MLGKVEIKGKIVLKTGMHIGGTTEFSAIGAIDSPVVRDTITDLPYIPGSSIKGKIRYLLFKRYEKKESKLNISHNDDDPRILRLFGASNDGKNKQQIKSRVYFSDSFIQNEEEIKDKGINSFTEVKFENTIDRFTAVANPRQIERVIKGTEFNLNIIYNLENGQESREDIKLLKEGIELLNYDYIGGNGSRGYGRVDIRDLSLECVVGELDKDLIEELRKIIRWENEL